MQVAAILGSSEEMSQRAEFDALVDQSYKKVYRQAYRLLHDASEAEDATQEAFLNAWRGFARFDAARLPHLDKASAWEAWLHRIVTNVVYNRLRSRKQWQRRPLSLDAPSEIVPGETLLAWIPDAEEKQPEQTYLDREFHEQVDALLSVLPQDQATVLRLRVFDKCTYEEIAESIDCPVGTVRSRIHRACEKLRVVMKTGRASRSRAAQRVANLPQLSL